MCMGAAGMQVLGAFLSHMMGAGSSLAGVQANLLPWTHMCGLVVLLCFLPRRSVPYNARHINPDGSGRKHRYCVHFHLVRTRGLEV
jgi:hypothetical protein